MMEFPMPGKLEDLVVDWRDAARPLLMIDEVRKAKPTQTGQYILYTTVVTDTRSAVIFHDEAQHARAKLSRTPAATTLKGSTLFGTRSRRSHEPMRDYFF